MWISSKEAVETLVTVILLLVSDCCLGELGHSFYYHKWHEHRAKVSPFLYPGNSIDVNGISLII